MQAISRDQKINHLSINPPGSVDAFLGVVQVEQDNLFPAGETLSQRHERSTGIKDRTLWDFEVWLHSAPEAQGLLVAGSSTVAALPEYARAIKSEHARIEQLVCQSRQPVGRRLDILAEQGHVPAVLAERFKQSAVATNVALKIFDSSHDSRSTGFYEPDNHTIYFRPWASNRSLVRRYVHESFHALSGTTTKINNDQIYTSRTGLGTTVVSETDYSMNSILRHRALNEGATEYMVNITVYGRPGLISSEDRSDKDSGVYICEREILKIITDRIGLDTVLNAYAEDYNPDQTGTLEHTRKFVRLIRKTYGPGFLGKLDRIDREKGVEHALIYMKAADYIFGNRERQKSTGNKVTQLIKALKTEA